MSRQLYPAAAGEDFGREFAADMVPVHSKR